jgi:ankyrin repeat protein
MSILAPQIESKIDQKNPKIDDPLVSRGLINRALIMGYHTSNAIRKITACFCCFWGVNENVNFFQQDITGSYTRQPAFLEENLCRFPLISSDLLEILPDSVIDLLDPLLIDGCLGSSINSLIDTHPFVAAASLGNLEAVKLLSKRAFENSCIFDREVINSACLFASANGHCEIVCFLIAKVIPESGFFIEPEVLKSCSIFAAANGHSQVLKFLFEDAFQKSSYFIDRELFASCCICASINGHVNTLKFLFVKAFPENLFFIDQAVLNSCCICAAANGQLLTLRFLFKKATFEYSLFLEPDLLQNCYIFASRRGHFEIIDFLFQSDVTPFAIDCLQRAEIY